MLWGCFRLKDVFCFSTWKIPPFTILAYLSLLFKLCAFIHLCVCMDKSDNYFLHTHFGGNWLFRLFDDLCSVENLQFTKDVFQTRNILATTITAIDYTCLIFLMFLWLIGYFACSLIQWCNRQSTCIFCTKIVTKFNRTFVTVTH